MQYTTHYNLNLPEGTDIVNPLVQDNPNYTKIDNALYANKVCTVGNAAEIKSGTVHAITRSDADIDVIRFTATGDWITGDTMTVDGSPVSVYLQDGTAPLTGAYVINTEVVAVINGSRVTLYGAQKLPGYTASDISYDNTVSGLTASDVQGAIDEVNHTVGILSGKSAYLLFYNASNIVAFKHDRNISVDFSGATISTGTNLGTLSPDFVPASPYFGIVADATNGQPVILAINAAGVVTVETMSAVTITTPVVIVGSISYIH